MTSFEATMKIVFLCLSKPDKFHLLKTDEKELNNIDDLISSINKLYDAINQLNSPQKGLLSSLYDDMMERQKSSISSSEPEAKK